MTTYANYSFPDASGLSNMTALQAILKEYYGPQQIKVLVYRRNKLFAMTHKEEDWADEHGHGRVTIGVNNGTARGVTVGSIGNFFSAGRHDGPSAGYYWAYFANCQCMHYTGKPVTIPS